MRYLLLILLAAALAGNVNKSFSWDSKVIIVDTNVFKYFPLNIGNRWTWYLYRTYFPGSGYESLTILDRRVINNHNYYFGRTDNRVFYNNQYSTSYLYYRIDSLTGNLYTYDSVNNRDCLSDSLNSGINDSAAVGCGLVQWYRCDTGSYNIFNQNFQTKIFSWSNYFEAGGFRKYSKNIGKVYEWNQAVMAITNYTLLGCIINGILYGDTNTFIGIHQINSQVPDKFSLSQNYPNPFNPATNIKFQIPKQGYAKITVFDVLGKEVQTLVNENLSPGTYEAVFDGSNLPSGVYYYQLTISNEQLSMLYKETKKMVLIK